MNMNRILLLPILLPIAAGLAAALLPAMREKKLRQIFAAAVLTVNLILVIGIAVAGDCRLEVFRLTHELPVLLKTDGMARLFTVLVSVMWLMAGIFSFEYMNHEEHHCRYYGFYLVSLGVLIGLGYAGNYLTMYLFFELMTLLTMPLVLHSGTKEATAAGLKYLFYSIFGASMGLLGFFFLYTFGTTIEFTAGGGILNAALVSGYEGWILTVIFLVIVGFGAKAGMFPLHAWLPTAHPVAPAPASAVLSGVITKAGVLAIVRVVYYLVGPSYLTGTWVQYVWAALALATIFMGSMLAYKENILKKRLAYSTVSQVSYILFGLSMMNVTAVTGALLHVVFHSVIKDTLFLCAGAIIYKTHKTEVRQLEGIGREMPVTMTCFTIVSLALIGVPPLCGFISKFYLASGAIESGLPVFTWLGPAVLLVSAFLTVGYLLVPVIRGFFPGAGYVCEKPARSKGDWMLTAPIVVLAAAAVLFGVYCGPLMQFVSGIAALIV